jgi:hypothetical protein
MNKHAYSHATAREANDVDKMDAISKAINTLEDQISGT